MGANKGILQACGSPTVVDCQVWWSLHGVRFEHPLIIIRHILDVSCATDLQLKTVGLCEQRGSGGIFSAPHLAAPALSSLDRNINMESRLIAQSLSASSARCGLEVIVMSRLRVCLSTPPTRVLLDSTLSTTGSRRAHDELTTSSEVVPDPPGPNTLREISRMTFFGGLGFRSARITGQCKEN